MQELARYTDHRGRSCRLAFVRDAWVRQECRQGVWVTMERHPVREWGTNSIPRRVEA